MQLPDYPYLHYHLRNIRLYIIHPYAHHLNPRKNAYLDYLQFCAMDKIPHLNVSRGCRILICTEFRQMDDSWMIMTDSHYSNVLYVKEILVVHLDTVVW